MRRTLVSCALLVAVVTACSSGASSTAGTEPAAPAAATPTGPAPPTTVSPTDAATTFPIDPVGSEDAGDVAGPVGEPRGTPRCEPSAGETGAQVCTTSVFEPQLTFELPSGWMPEADDSELPDASVYLSEAGTGYLSFVRVTEVFTYPADGGAPTIAPAPDDLVGFLSDLPGSEASAPQAVTVAGRDATQFDVTITDAPEATPADCGPPQDAVYVFNMGAPCVPFFFPAGVVVRVVVLEPANEPPLVIAMEADTPDARDAVFSTFDTILDSLEITGAL